MQIVKPSARFVEETKTWIIQGTLTLATGPCLDSAFARWVQKKLDRQIGPKGLFYVVEQE